MSATTPARPEGRPTGIDAVVVGGSAGAIEAMTRLLELLPPGFAAPMVVVIHLPRRRLSGLAEVLAPHTRREVREAQDKEPLAAGAVHVAPPDYHLLLDEGPALALSVDDPVNFSIPSIDVLFESAAGVCGPRLAAVVLSGANEDGARGAAAVAQAGGAVLVQAPAEAGVRAMPEATLARCPAARALPLAELARELGRLAGAGVVP